MSASAHADSGLGKVTTQIPARMDRLPWSRWHWMIIIGLGTVWILDGLEVTIVGNLAARLTEDGSGIELSDAQIGQAAAIYVAGACLGALFFGRMTDIFGRKKLFLLTLAVYLTATVLTAFAESFLWFAIMRFFTGAGIGGEYAAINSAIDELIPARVRGRIDLLINGSFWLGAAGGSVLSLALLNESWFATDMGWRIAFAFGAILGVGILIIRRMVPESPRWLVIHGREEEAEKIVSDIEKRVMAETNTKELPEPKGELVIEQRKSIGLVEIARTLFGKYTRRSNVGLALFVGQAFIYNAVFFTYGLVLAEFYDIGSGQVPLYIIPFALGNFAGPLLLGKLFDTVGRKPMIAGTYILSGVLLTLTAFLFRADVLSATTQTAAWCVIFFFASAGAAAAYLTVSEVFPMETRALAIAFFYAVGTALGGITGPLIFGKLIATGEEVNVFWGYMIGATVMVLGGIIQAIWGTKAERRKLEDVATPLTASADQEEPSESRGDEARTPDRAGDAPTRPVEPAYPGGAGVAVRSAGGRFGRGSSSGWSPRGFAYPSETVEREMEAYASTIRGILDEHGELSRKDLQILSGARYWGPGCFGKALAVAQAKGDVERVARDRFRRAGA